MIDVLKMNDDLLWLKNQLELRHDIKTIMSFCESGEWFDVMFVTKPESLIVSVTVPYEEILVVLDKETFTNKVEKDMARLMTMLLTTEKLAGLRHVYAPTQEFIQFWDKTYGRTT